MILHAPQAPTPPGSNTPSKPRQKCKLATQLDQMALERRTFRLLWSPSSLHVRLRTEEEAPTKREHGGPDRTSPPATNLKKTHMAGKCRDRLKELKHTEAMINKVKHSHIYTNLIKFEIWSNLPGEFRSPNIFKKTWNSGQGTRAACATATWSLGGSQYRGWHLAWCHMRGISALLGGTFASAGAGRDI